MNLILDPTAWVALATLIAMEIVLGVDNLIFVTISTNRVAASRRAAVRKVGMGLALLFRLGLLAMVAQVVKLTSPLFIAFAHAFSWRDMIMIAGGLFLIWKSTREIHENVEPGHAISQESPARALGFLSATLQVIVLDLVFSIDSIVTAVGMTDHIPIMIVAVVVAVALMFVAAGALSAFIERNPTLVMLALGFLLMIGMVLIADGFGVHVPKGYIYVAVLFSGAVEALNMLRRSRAQRRGSGETG
jgi:predicted tellurium resistance membrane protein TerC